MTVQVSEQSADSSDVASALATMTAHRDALASALRALHASADFAYSRFASRRPAMSIGDMDAMESALKNTLAALREHADTEVR